MVHQNSLRFFGDIAYESYGGLVLDDQEGARLARACTPDLAPRLFWLHGQQCLSAGWSEAEGAYSTMSGVRSWRA
jgi:hypothetical protein